ncbi:MAG: hypothetical protein HY706_06800 [Candidatus Hydrogenedentes bacterium]|nr:hypothetical protein [Candidatus Hydrogenedentota bacterium]
MEPFIAKHRVHVLGVLNGWDRLVFRGLYRLFSSAAGVTWYLHQLHVRLVDFRDFFQALTHEIVTASQAQAARAQRPNVYLASSATSKEEAARRTLEESPVASGLIGVVRCVEPCWTYEMRREAATASRELVAAWRKCTFLYQYGLDPEFGFIHVRVQTWLPFTVQVYVNGREWLAQRMDEEGLEYRRADNCFTWVEDFERAQGIMDAPGQSDWPNQLDALAGLDASLRVEEIFAPVSRAVKTRGRRVRALRIWTAEDQALLAAAAALTQKVTIQTLTQAAA